MAAVHIYVEGGGDGKEGKRAVRTGFQEFFSEFEGVMPRVVACGGRGQAHDDFRTGLRTHPEAFVILLVDAEGPVQPGTSPCQHLTKSDGWEFSDVDDPHVHLMVQAFEAWLIADREAIEIFYGDGVNMNAIPTTRNPENIPKDDLKFSLDRAARHTPKRGYHEITHGPKILAAARPPHVRARCPHCRELLEGLCKATGKARLPDDT